MGVVVIVVWNTPRALGNRSKLMILNVRVRLWNNLGFFGVRVEE